MKKKSEVNPMTVDTSDMLKSILIIFPVWITSAGGYPEH